jgi:hypothetical protein
MIYLCLLFVSVSARVMIVDDDGADETLTAPCGGPCEFGEITKTPSACKGESYCSGLRASKADVLFRYTTSRTFAEALVCQSAIYIDLMESRGAPRKIDYAAEFQKIFLFVRHIERYRSRAPLELRVYGDSRNLSYKLKVPYEYDDVNDKKAIDFIVKLRATIDDFLSIFDEVVVEVESSEERMHVENKVKITVPKMN